MNNVNRTLTRCVGYGCLVGGLLVSAPALASGTWIKNTSGSIDGGTYIKVDARAKWTAPDQSVTRYKNLPVNIAKSTLRTGAVAALGRGLMHPGLQLAVAAVGFVIANNNEIHMSDEPTNTSGVSLDDTNGGNGWCHGTNACDGVSRAVFSSPSAVLSNKLESLPGYYAYDISGSSDRLYFELCNNTGWDENNNRCSKSYIETFYAIRNNLTAPFGDDYYDQPAEFPTRQVEESDLVQLDPHIPPQLVGELITSSDDIPEWEDTISVMGMPASSVDPGTKNMPPEVADIIGRWSENMDASFNGEEAPNPDDPTTGNTAEEQVAEETLEGDVPPFPDQEIAWQTESVDLPSYSSGIGAGSCPAPVSIALPLSADPIELSYQPACDLATMVRPALVGICGLIALMIVLRARGGA